ncbi:HCP-like protein [Backusella circina FSU 941]|nr:HCP-like protein [Backusella circina FSU 941]
MRYYDDAYNEYTPECDHDERYYDERSGYIEKELVKRAEKGDLDAYFTIGKRYEEGYPSLHKSIVWYKRATESGHAESQVALGDLYLGDSTDGITYTKSNDYNITTNWRKVLNWYERAFKNGAKKAAFKIGDVYLTEGKEEKGAAQHAMKWLTKAHEIGVINAGVDIGYIYENGIGVEQDYNLAKEWYLKSYEAGYISSGLQLVALYFKDQWEEYDLDKAEE